MTFYFLSLLIHWAYTNATPGACVGLFDDGIYQSGEGVVYKQNIYRGMEIQIDPALETRRIVSVPARMQVARRSFYLAHGYSANTSHTISLLDLVSYLGAIEARGVEKKAVREVTEMQGYKVSYASASDAPFHGSGPRSARFLELENTIQWYVRDMQHLKNSQPSNPLIVIARSGSTNVMLEIQNRYPELIDALIVVSPPEISRQSVSDLAQRTKDSIQDNLNLEGIIFSMTIKHALQAQQLTKPKIRVPTIFLFGGKDAEITAQDRDVHIANFKLSLPDGKFDRDTPYYVFFPEAGHDVFRGNKEHDRKTSIALLLKYLDDIGL
jgi:pimeloyl-ACP methyl ester carboxylesterase